MSAWHFWHFSCLFQALEACQCVCMSVCVCLSVCLFVPLPKCVCVSARACIFWWHNTCRSLLIICLCPIYKASPFVCSIWDLATSQCTGSLVGHEWGLTSLALTSDGNTCISSSGDETIKCVLSPPLHALTIPCHQVFESVCM